MIDDSYFLIFQERKITKYSETIPNKMQIKIECFFGAVKAMLQAERSVGVQN